MSTNHGDGVSRLPFVTDSEGDDGGRVAGEVVFSTRNESGSPRITLLDLLVASGLKTLLGRVYSVEGYVRMSVYRLMFAVRTNIRVGEALTNSIKSSAGLGDALLAIFCIPLR